MDVTVQPGMWLDCFGESIFRVKAILFLIAYPCSESLNQILMWFISWEEEQGHWVRSLYLQVYLWIYFRYVNLSDGHPCYLMWHFLLKPFQVAMGWKLLHNLFDISHQQISISENALVNCAFCVDTIITSKFTHLKERGVGLNFISQKGCIFSLLCNDAEIQWMEEHWRCDLRNTPK